MTGGLSGSNGVGVTVVVNGREEHVADGATVADLVLGLAGRGRGTAVARNGEVVPRSQWATTALDPEDVVEVLTAAQGG